MPRPRKIDIKDCRIVFLSKRLELVTDQRYDLHRSLVDLINEIFNKQHAHQCAGYDCAQCTPVGSIAMARKIIDRVLADKEKEIK